MVICPTLVKYHYCQIINQVPSFPQDPTDTNQVHLRGCVDDRHVVAILEGSSNTSSTSSEQKSSVWNLQPSRDNQHLDRQMSRQTGTHNMTQALSHPLYPQKKLDCASVVSVVISEVWPEERAVVMNRKDRSKRRHEKLFSNGSLSTQLHVQYANTSWDGCAHVSLHAEGEIYFLLRAFSQGPHVTDEPEI